MEKMLHELSIKKPRASLPSLEIRLSDTDDGVEYTEPLEKALALYAREHPELIATIYDCCSLSVNFGDLGTSLFFGVAGSKPLLNYLHATLSRNRQLRVRLGGSVKPEELRYHVEKGQAWKMLDMVTFMALDGEG
ncbi:MAG: hypothetical protein FWG59_00120 [Betaproteobacteria bacterium]|nr:hypothetical protein [Betaproteobacteria bacterium]